MCWLLFPRFLQAKDESRPPGFLPKVATHTELLTVETKNIGNTIQFWVNNRTTYDLTVTIELTKLQNMKSDEPLPRTLTVPGGATIEAMILSQIQKSKPYEKNYRYYWITGSRHGKHDESCVYALPYRKGETHRVTQGFYGSFTHHGNEAHAIDWAMPEGTPVLAARDGVVIGVKSSSNKGGKNKVFADDANFVMIRHGDGTTGEYKHFKYQGVKVSVGRTVKVGDLLGLSGNTGYSDTPHLHFFVYKALNGKTRQTYAIKFRTTSGGAETLHKDQEYTAP